MADQEKRRPTAADTVKRVATQNSGLFGNAARAVRDRSRSIDDAVDAAVSGAHDRQHTDKSNR